jgi:hypothetical protein
MKKRKEKALKFVGGAPILCPWINLRSRSGICQSVEDLKSDS